MKERGVMKVTGKFRKSMGGSFPRTAKEEKKSKKIRLHKKKKGGGTGGFHFFHEV